MASQLTNETTAELRHRVAQLEAENERLREQLRRPMGTVPVTPEQMSLVADSIPGLVGYVGPDERYRFNNKTFERWLGRRRSEMLGRPIAEVLGAQAHEALRPLIDAALDGEQVTAEREIIFGDGTARFVHIAFVPYISPEAVPQGFFQFITDLTTARRAGTLMRESEKQLQDILDALPVVVFTKDRAGHYLFVNRAFEASTGKPKASVVGRTDAEIYPAETAASFAESDAKAMAGGTISFETTELLQGDLRTFHVTKVPVHSIDGVVEGVCGIVVDITERKRFEAHQRLLVDELNHRVKNTLAIVQSLAMQSLKTVDRDLRGTFERRLCALAGAHSLLTRENWTSASLGSIVETAVSPFGDRSRIHVSGPDLRLAPKTAVSIAMALHELATNAAKYGSLSTGDGHVEIGWNVTGEGEAARLHFEWRERGGPSVIPPARRGFGSRMVEQGLAVELSGKVELRYEPTGVVCTIDAPLPES